MVISRSIQDEREGRGGMALISAGWFQGEEGGGVS
jgi:hypothetical protein